MPGEKGARASHYFLRWNEGAGICLRNSSSDLSFPPLKRIELALERFLDHVRAIAALGRGVAIELSGESVRNLNVCHGDRLLSKLEEF
jgi:hypothetical protein